MTEPTPITFEKGYRRLQEIADEVNRTEVPVDRMGDLFAEGKGLEKALTDHLDAQKARIEQIERGEEIQAFRITSETDDDASRGVAPSDPDDDLPF
jgi:exodeoxyribonuclease VII small subunit